MDFAGSRYYRICRILLTCLGLWPYYTQRVKYVYCIILFLLLLSSTFFQLTSFITNECNLNFFLNVSSTIGASTYYTIKYFSTLINGNKIKELMEQVRYDWNFLKEEEELNIIHHRSNIGRLFTIITMIGMYTTFLILALIFFSPNILNIVMPLNESRKSWQLPSTLEFFIDKEKYVELLQMYLFLTIFIGTTTLITAESFLHMYMQHICAMFQITSYRIERIVNRSQSKSLVLSEKRNSHKNIVKFVNGHQNVIKFIETINSCFKISHSMAIPIAVASLSINLYRLCTYIIAEDVRDTIIAFLYIVTVFFYMFYCNYMGQELIDHGNNIFKKICNTRWYAAPLNIQKYLMIIMHRSMKTCTMTVCFGLFIPSLQGFAALISSSLSYFMVIYSIRR